MHTSLAVMNVGLALFNVCKGVNAGAFGLLVSIGQANSLMAVAALQASPGLQTPPGGSLVQALTPAGSPVCQVVG